MQFNSGLGSSSGHVEAGEDLKDAVCREVVEETGIAIRKQSLRFLAVYEATIVARQKQFLIVFFACQAREPIEIFGDPKEVGAIAFIPQKVEEAVHLLGFLLFSYSSLHTHTCMFCCSFCHQPSQHERWERPGPH